MKAALNALDPLSRRGFVERLAKAAMGVSVMPFADQLLAQQAVGGKAKHIIYLFHEKVCQRNVKNSFLLAR